MVQDQLTEYISSQMKLGVSREAIKSALVSAGWVSADVEDTLKKIEGSAPAVQAAVATKPMQPVASSGISPLGSQNSAKQASSPQMIRVSDLVSASPGSSTAANSASSAKPAKIEPSTLGGKISGNSFEASAASSSPSGSGSSKKSLVVNIIGSIFILALAGATWYFYSQNGGLAAQVSSLNSQSASVSTQLASLKAQLDASSSDSATQIATLQSANDDLALNLSFYAAPIGGATSTATTPVAVTISGSLSGGGKAPYAITTPRGAKIFIANSADVKIAPQLKPLIGDTLQLTGTYVPGSDQITVATITNLSPAPAQAASTTTTTTPPPPPVPASSSTP